MKKIGLGIAVVVVIFAIVVATRPATYHVERSLSIAAPPENIFMEINSMKSFVQWNPWNRLDPKMKVTFQGNESGVGASYSWAGNDQAGEGRMTITDSKPVEKVGYRVEFVKPYESTAQITIKLSPENEKSTLAVWSMDGNNDFMGKAFSMFMNMDKMVGSDFELGLKNLAAFVTAKTPASAPASAPVAPANP